MDARLGSNYTPDIVHHCHCVKSDRIRSYSRRHFPVFGLNTGKYGSE